MSTETVSTRLRGWCTKTLVAPLAAVAMLITGGAAAAQTPSPTQLRVELSVDIDYVDPALSYYVPTWAIEYATCAKLVNYPDRSAPEGGRLQPEVALAMPTVSPDGKTYTFQLRDDYVFSPPSNERVTAAHFKWAIDRALNRQMNSPSQPFIGDIVGAQDVINGTTNSTSGVVAERQHPYDHLSAACGRLPRAARDAVHVPTSALGSRRSRRNRCPGAFGGAVLHRRAGPATSEILSGRTRTTPAPAAPLRRDPLSGSASHWRRSSCGSNQGETDWETFRPPPTPSSACASDHARPASSPRPRYLCYPSPTVLYLAMNHDRPLFGDDPTNGPGLDPRGNVRSSRP